MAGFERACGAGGAGRAADACVGQQGKQRFAVYALKAIVDRAGQAVLTAAVEAGAGNLLKACTQGITQISYISSVDRKLLLRVLERCGKTSSLAMYCLPSA